MQHSNVCTCSIDGQIYQTVIKMFSINNNYFTFFTKCRSLLTKTNCQKLYKRSIYQWYLDQNVFKNTLIYEICLRKKIYIFLYIYSTVRALILTVYKITQLGRKKWHFWSLAAIVFNFGPSWAAPLVILWINGHYKSRKLRLLGV